MLVRYTQQTMVSDGANLDLDLGVVTFFLWKAFPGSLPQISHSCSVSLFPNPLSPSGQEATAVCLGVMVLLQVYTS